MSNKTHPEVQVIVDLQYGSTGKGALVGRIGQDWQPDAVATGWGTNAGHTMITNAHGKRVATQVASAAVLESVGVVFVGGGSMINPHTFIKELDEVQEIRNKLGYKAVHVFIASTASIILPQHEQAEAGAVAIGSTMKGNGAALVQKVNRNPLSLNVAGRTPTPLEYRDDISIVPMSQYVMVMCERKKILVEGAQGFSLGLNQDFYPYCTSRECTPQQICTEAGVPYGWVSKVIGCLRTYPIRVANRFDDHGKQIGWSGGHYEDQRETSFDEIGVAGEITTVTKLPRRVFTFSQMQTFDALLQCQPDELFLNFCNYCIPEEFKGIISSISEAASAAGYVNPNIIRYIGFTPNSDDIIDGGGSCERYAITITDGIERSMCNSGVIFIPAKWFKQ